MTGYITYNIRVEDQPGALVSLGLPNIEDINYNFRIDVTSTNQSTGWLNHEEIISIKVPVQRNHIVRVMKQEKVTGDILRNYQFNIEQEWPVDAVGPQITIVNYIIE